MRNRLALALRHKIMVAFVLFMVGGFVFTGVVYSRHTEIQDKLQFIESADDLLNNVLEVRRYEKNFFLYGGDDNFRIMLEFLTLAENQLDSLSREGKGDLSASQLGRNRSMLVDYLQASRDYEARLKEHQIGQDDLKLRELEDHVRNVGRSLTESIVELVKKERHDIDVLVENQKRSLFYSLFAFIVLSVVVAYYLFFLIFKPMATIQAAASEISAGNVREIPPVSGSPEVHSLIAALNTMIRELDKKSEQLVQREKMAALGTLTSGVAHELNNPLSNISSSTQIILEELEEGDLEFQRNLLDGVEEQVEKARDIVRSLLEFAREKEFEPTLLDLRQLVENTVRLVRGEIPPEVSVQIDVPQSIELEADQRRLSQALMNLIINGLQAMEGSGGVLTVNAYYSPKERGVVIEVTDTGQGISEDNLAKIFDPFFSTKEVGSGTGLGLYVAYGIVQKHKGQITVRSQVGHGTTFTLTLPRKQNMGDRG